jgi:drug/metabolite transporter (DMT)-like permease
LCSPAARTTGGAGTALPAWALLVYVMVLGSFLLSFVAIGRLRATPAGVVATTEVVFGFVVAGCGWARRWTPRSSSQRSS